MINKIKQVNIKIFGINLKKDSLFFFNSYSGIETSILLL